MRILEVADIPLESVNAEAAIPGDTLKVDEWDAACIREVKCRGKSGRELQSPVDLQWCKSILQEWGPSAIQ